jgi:hypothetical protein
MPLNRDRVVGKSRVPAQHRVSQAAQQCCQSPCRKEESWFAFLCFIHSVSTSLLLKTPMYTIREIVCKALNARIPPKLKNIRDSPVYIVFASFGLVCRHCIFRELWRQITATAMERCFQTSFEIADLGHLKIIIMDEYSFWCSSTVCMHRSSRNCD